MYVKFSNFNKLIDLNIHPSLSLVCEGISINDFKQYEYLSYY